MSTLRLVPLLFLLCALIGCQMGGVAAGGRAPKPGLMLTEDAPVADALRQMPGLNWQFKNGEVAGDDAESAAAAPPTQDRLLVYRGEMRVEVARAEDAMQTFLTSVKQWGGYLQSQQETTVVVRVPATQFDAAMLHVRAAGRVLGESRSANDVTEEFVDLGIRLDNARKSRDRLLEVLQKAEKVEDILKVEAELRRLTEEIERMEGRRKFLNDQVTMATLQVVFQSASGVTSPNRRVRDSRFDWVNQIGAETIMEAF